MSDVAGVFGASWDAINDAVTVYGTARLDLDVDRVAAVAALGVDEVLFARLDRWRTKAWSTSIVDVADPFHAVKFAIQTVRGFYDIDDSDLAGEFVERLGHDLQDRDCPPELRQLGRTIVRWRHQIAAWHQARVSNGPTEAANNLIKRVKRVAFGFRRFTNYRIRALLYAGKPNWDLLTTITPR